MQKIKFCDVTKVKSPDEGIITFTLTRRVKDRDGDIVEPTGAVLDAYRKNPVVLWAHDLRRPPIGKILPDTIEINRNRITADVQFDLNDEFARMVFQKYLDGFLKAGSIRFIPLEYEEMVDKDDESRRLRPGYLIKKWELLEFSAVPVPANPAALARDADDEFIRKCHEAINPVVGESISESWDDIALAWAKSIESNDDVTYTSTTAPDGIVRIPWSKQGDELGITIEDDFEEMTMGKVVERLEKLQDMVDELREMVQMIIESDQKSVVAFSATPTAPESTNWDKNVALTRVRKWASSDGSGDKNKINWAKYRRAFAWYDPADAENFGAYKLPHHDVRDGELVVVWAGVRAAMAALMGARGGVNIPDSDRRGVYNHLARHYKQFDKEPPDFKSVELLDSQDEMILDEILRDPKTFDVIVERVMEIIGENHKEDDTDV